MKTFLPILLILVGSYAQGQSNILNVTNFGAVGDAVQFYVNTVSNSVVVRTTNQLSNTSIGDAIEIFNAGTQTYGVNSYGTNAYGNMDLVATITNVVNGTNIFISLPAQNTLVNAFATYGHNNRTNFQNALNAAGTNTTIQIPAGEFLILSDTNASMYASFGLILNKGGITINGAGPSNTVLLGEGARQMKNVFGSVQPWRGVLFMENNPIANNYPVVLENFTLDGGVQQGNTPIHGIEPNSVDGLGWDTTHDAFLIWFANPCPEFAIMTWTNLVFQHWRGEMVKSLDASTNGSLLVEDCVFQDGNATAINIYPSVNFTNCVFNNLFQVAEYYQAYSTNTCYFQDNLCTNITGNEFALNGGKGNNPYFILQSNVFYLSGNGNNGIETTPADNVIISNNIFICQNYANAIVLGAAGYQGTFDNSNITITANTIINPSTFVEIGGASSSTAPNRVESISITGNILEYPNNSANILMDYGWATNVVLSGNDCSQFNNLVSSAQIYAPTFPAPYAKVTTNNLYWCFVQNTSLVTNGLGYGGGCRYYSKYSTPGSAYYVNNSDSNQIPAGAQMLFNNQNTFNMPLLLNSPNGPEVIVTNGTEALVNFVNGQWVYSGGLSNLTAANPVIQVSPNSLAFGTVLSGGAITNGVTVQNVGGGTLVGAASASAPFSILSGASYSLAANQSQTVNVVFNPTSATTYNQNLTFSGGNGASVALSGSATNVTSAVPPLVSPIRANAINLGTNPAVLILNPGSFQLSATASAYQNDPISWQWEFSVNGGPQTVYLVGSSTNPVVNLVNTVNSGGNTNVWTLQVTDTKNGLSAQSQIATVVVLPSPLGIQIGLHASIN